MVIKMVLYVGVLTGVHSIEMKSDMAALCTGIPLCPMRPFRFNSLVVKGVIPKLYIGQNSFKNMQLFLNS